MKGKGCDGKILSQPRPTTRRVDGKGRKKGRRLVVPERQRKRGEKELRHVHAAQVEEEKEKKIV